MSASDRANTDSRDPMPWEGVGPKMAGQFAPFLVAAIAVRVAWPEAAAIPSCPATVRSIVGGVMLTAGLAFWAWSAVYFLRHFFAGGLLTTGPFGWCRNPIYASFIVLVLPSVALLTNAWPFLAADIALYLAFRRNIGVEDQMLARRFGVEYDRYRASVGELIPVPPRFRRMARPGNRRGRA